MGEPEVLNIGAMVKDTSTTTVTAVKTEEGVVAASVEIVKEHTVRQTEVCMVYYPDHVPREGDPHYKTFHATVKKIKDAGLWKCNIPGCQNTDIELHHDKVEFSLMNGVDLEKFNEFYGLHLSDEEFKDWVEGPGNTTPYCVLHHRGALGIHHLHPPEWNAQFVWKDSLPPPMKVLQGDAKKNE